MQKIDTVPSFPTFLTQNDLTLQKDSKVPLPCSLEVSDVSDKIIEAKELIIETSENSLQNVNQAEALLKLSHEIELVQELMESRPESEEEVNSEVTDISLADFVMITKYFVQETTLPKTIIRSTSQYNEVLSELDRFKGHFGGDSRFKESKPEIDFSDYNKKFLGISMPVAKDFLRNTVDEKWRPKKFWQAVAALFGINKEIPLSKYEDAYIRVLRLGLVSANKEQIIEILDSKKSKRYIEMSQISGLDWHPASNTPAVEKEYLELIDLFLTKYFNEAKDKGDEALIKYFNTLLDGFCFEARSKAIEKYIIENPLKDSEFVAVSDWDSGASVIKAFDKELMAAGLAGSLLTPLEFLDNLKAKDIFETEFLEGDERKKPSLETFHTYALMQIQNVALDNYNYEDFLQTELDILKSKEGDVSRERFIKQLEKRLLDTGEIEISQEGQFIPFSPESEETIAFINQHF